jgi:hypothetical protein
MSQLFGLDDVSGKAADGNSERNGKLPRILLRMEHANGWHKSCCDRVSTLREMMAMTDHNTCMRKTLFCHIRRRIASFKSRARSWQCQLRSLSCGPDIQAAVHIVNDRNRRLHLDLAVSALQQLSISHEEKIKFSPYCAARNNSLVEQPVVSLSTIA